MSEVNYGKVRALSVIWEFRKIPLPWIQERNEHEERFE